MTEKKSIWSRSNAFEALKANHASLIIITFLQASISFFASLNTGFLPNELMQANADASHSLRGVDIVSILAMFVTGMVLLLLSHYYNRYGMSLSTKDKNFSSYLWAFIKRTLWFTLLIFTVALLLGLAFGVLFIIGKKVLAVTSGKLIAILLGILLFIAFAAILIFIFLFSMMIYPPLLGQDEDKSFKTAFKNTKLIYVKFNKETFLFYLVWIIISVIISIGVNALVNFSKEDELLSNLHEVVVFFAIYFTTYMNVFATFVTQIFASQYYFELQAEKQQAIS